METFIVKCIDRTAVMLSTNRYVDALQCMRYYKHAYVGENLYTLLHEHTL